MTAIGDLYRRSGNGPRVIYTVRKRNHSEQWVLVDPAGNVRLVSDSGLASSYWTLVDGAVGGDGASR